MIKIIKAYSKLLDNLTFEKDEYSTLRNDNTSTFKAEFDRIQKRFKVSKFYYTKRLCI